MASCLHFLLNPFPCPHSPPSSSVSYDLSPFLIPGPAPLSQPTLQVPPPGYEAYPRSRYQQNSPSRLPRYSQPPGLHPSLEQAPAPSTAASQQSLADNDPSDTPHQHFHGGPGESHPEEVAKLAKKQTDMFGVPGLMPSPLETSRLWRKQAWVFPGVVGLETWDDAESFSPSVSEKVNRGASGEQEALWNNGMLGLFNWLYVNKSACGTICWYSVN